MGQGGAESDGGGPPLHQALCLTFVSSTLMTVLSVQSCCAHFTDEETKAHKVNGRSGDENLHLMLLKESVFNI